MRLIAHRGNIKGPIPERENSPEYIAEALKLGFDVEVDIWYVNGSFYLGHDEPKYIIDRPILTINHWYHAKNLEALRYLILYENNFPNAPFNYFWHQDDDFALTNNKHIWTYPGRELVLDSICVHPEIYNYDSMYWPNCYGMCSDYIVILK